MTRKYILWVILGFMSIYGTHSWVALEPGVMYTHKGTGTTLTTSGITSEGIVNSAYLDLPLLLKLYVADGFNLFIGPQFSYHLSSNYDLEVDGHAIGPIRVYLFENPGRSRVKGPWPKHEIATIDGIHANDVAIADIDGDGKPDVIVRHKHPHDLKVIFRTRKPPGLPNLLATGMGRAYLRVISMEMAGRTSL